MSDNGNNTRGSEWRKWDLHIHTPYSIVQNYGGDDKFDDFIEGLENLPEEVKVIGINDYYFIDGYKKVMDYKKKGKLQNIDKILPILEFRIDTFGSASENKFQKVNFHILFNIDEGNLEKEIELIQNEFINQIKLSKHHGTKILSKDNFISESSDNKLNTGFNEIIPSTEEVKKLLSTDTWKNKTFTFLGYIEWNNLNKSSQLKPEKEALYNIANAFFTASETDDITKKEEVLYGFGNKPLLHSGDIHDFKKLGEGYKCFTWIKADPTFEGLKQIIYEPEQRVFIGENKPTSNLYKIDEIKLNFNSDVKIQANGSENEFNFCFSDVQEKLHLSDKFNCFIGGRGSGKSSLLNLIYSHISGKKDTDFLEKNKLINFDINCDIDIDYNGEIEFLGQNKIEEFAIDYVKFSKAIYDRLENQKELKDESESLINYIIYLDEHIFNIKEIIKNKKELEELDKRLKNYQSIIDVVKGDEYNKLKDKLDTLSKQYYDIERSKDKYSKLYNEFNDFVSNFSEIDDKNNCYDEKYNDIFNKLETIKEDIGKYDFSDIEKIQEDILENLKIEKSELNNYLIEKGLSEEKLKNLEEAQEGLHKFKLEQENINNVLDNYLELEKTFNLEDGRLTYMLYKSLIEKGLKEAEKKLNQVNNENIKKFEFNVDFNNTQAKGDLFDDFMNNFKKFQEPRLMWDNISKTLFNIEIEKVLDGSINKEEFLNEINKLGYGKGNEFLQNIFSIESNFDIYKTLIAKYKYNLNNYLKINILYDGRPIENSSFGQKCTVVILIMLLFGNKPIIIDEPEAHLDSSLIANYLVDLIKERKKERQIIFATHNANFVINGDAEQIFILENDKNKTIFTQTSIENEYNREKLLKLEGGKEAFKSRGKRYI